ncbi:hypothetical protein CVT26_007015 [Gymnopilus dilepis]|uniref:Major facilitator superfamily (MFS) profile domain-containing protein n=1 Tax=Gymnopilus dilepis TaxID=231916 RepID=A0A409W018_9AGAR|nr:hypothetical protein CVT26_007015 [Gymnopilus dilepis]
MAESGVSTSMTVADDMEKGSTSRGSTFDEKKDDENVGVVDVKDEKEGNAADVLTFPEGGFHAWAAVAGGYISAFGIYQDFYVREFLTNFSPSDIGWIGGVQIFLNFSLGAITGRIFDRGYAKHLMIACTIVYAISIFCLSLAHKNSYYQVFLTNGVGLGIAAGLTYPGNFAITGHYFLKKRALAVGLVSSGSALGAVIHPIMLNKLINGPVGFHNGVRISAAMNTVLLIAATLLTRTRLPPKAQQTFPVKKWLKEPPYLAIIIGAVFVFLGLFFSLFYLQLYSITRGVPASFAFYDTSILNAASFFGRTISGYYGRRIGVFNIGTFFTLGTGIVVLTMAAVNDITGTVFFAIFYGLCTGGCVAITNAMIANVSDHPSEVGTRLGLYFGIGGILGLFGKPNSLNSWVNIIDGLSTLLSNSNLRCSVDERIPLDACHYLFRSYDGRCWSVLPRFKTVCCKSKRYSKGVMFYVLPAMRTGTLRTSIDVVEKREKVTTASSGSLREEKEKEESVVIVDVEEGATGEDSLDEVLTFPEGGFRAWAAVAGGYVDFTGYTPARVDDFLCRFLIQFTCFGYINSFGVYQDFYVRHYLTAFTPSDIGWIGGVQIFLNFFLGAFSGQIFDRGYYKQLMYISTVLYAISLFCLSLAHHNSYYQVRIICVSPSAFGVAYLGQVLLTNGVGLGIASGLTYPGNFAIIGHYFVKKRALAVGLVSSGSALGAIIHPVMLNRLINGPVGFHNGVRISAAMNTILIIIACALTHTRLPPKSQQSFPILKWVREPQYLLLLIGAVFVFLGLFFSVFYLQLDAILHGVRPDFAFYSLSILNAASFFGRTITGFYGRKLGVFNIGASFTTAAGLVVLCLLAVKNITGVVLFSVFFGFFSGGSVALVNAMIAQTASNPNEVGTRLGIYFGVGGILGLFASPISGALLTSQYHWTRSILFAGITLTIAGLCFCLSRVFVAKMKGSPWIPEGSMESMAFLMTAGSTTCALAANLVQVNVEGLCEISSSGLVGPHVHCPAFIFRTLHTVTNGDLIEFRFRIHLEKRFYPPFHNVLSSWMQMSQKTARFHSSSPSPILSFVGIVLLDFTFDFFRGALYKEFCTTNLIGRNMIPIPCMQPMSIHFSLCLQDL